MVSLARGKATLHERIDRIEKQNRWLKGCMAILILSFASLAVIGAKAGPHDGQFRKITVKELAIIDGSGQECILIGSGQEGTGIKFLNKAKKKVLGIGITADERGSGILFADKEGRARIGLGLDKGLPSMAIVDENGKKIMGMGGDRTGYGLTIMDENEVERAGIGFKDGNTGIVLYDDKGQYVRGIIRQNDGVHYFSYINKKGEMMIVK